MSLNTCVFDPLEEIVLGRGKNPCLLAVIVDMLGNVTDGPSVTVVSLARAGASRRAK